ncbi:hypothetical protein ATI53_10484 [Salipiger aestuarii]|uniref:Uncharacterized protein n=1 Tax=Salipiger aestuarii TaxID=568098 RepID=A0A327XWD1_9RHOB|nr:hypothetical protein ATI53_10484 [Salipiger aestuarii]
MLPVSGSIQGSNHTKNNLSAKGIIPESGREPEKHQIGVDGAWRRILWLTNRT